MRSTVLVAAVVASFGCEAKSPSTDRPRSQPSESSPSPQGAHAEVTDLTATSTLAPMRAAFNAKKGEARFLTLLAPT